MYSIHSLGAQSGSEAYYVGYVSGTSRHPAHLYVGDNKESSIINLTMIVTASVNKSLEIN